MAWTKLKTAAVAGVAVILAVGTTGWIIRHQRSAPDSIRDSVPAASELSIQSLQGHWTGSNSAHPGQTCTVAISGDQIEYRGTDPNDWLRGNFVLNDKTEPRQLSVTILEPAHSSIVGIYEVDGDKLTIAVGPHGTNLRPVNFAHSRNIDVLELKHD